MIAGILPVRITGTEGHWQLSRHGTPYFIKGAAGSSRLDGLVVAGGNSFRTWGAEQLEQALKDAHARSLTVAAGIWLRHASELDYGNADRVAKQAEEVRAVVARFRGDRAVLLWGVGNEMENGNDTPALWQGVQEAVRAAKEADPDHPVMTSVAEVTQEKIDLIRRYAPDIDVLGINSYGGLPSLARRLRQFGWTKPYIVTEFGPLGHWECGKTAWGAPIEQTSTEKARTYQTGYEASVAGQPGMCLGSYAFLWGSKQEATPTWFGMMLATGEPLEAVDVMQMEWTGSWPRERAPRIVNFTLSGELQAIEPGEKLTTTLLADGAELRYRWEVRAEVAERRQDGKGEKTPEPLPIPFTSSPNGGGTFRAPTAAGSYRLYAYAISRDGRAATANIPFRVMA